MFDRSRETIYHHQPRLNLSTPQPLNLSTPQPLNLSTPQPLNPSTPQPLNSSTPQPLNLSTSQPLNSSTSQPLNPLHTAIHLHNAQRIISTILQRVLLSVHFLVKGDTQHDKHRVVRISTCIKRMVDGSTCIVVNRHYCC